jgi:hypothetical protein
VELWAELSHAVLLSGRNFDETLDELQKFVNWFRTRRYVSGRMAFDKDITVPSYNSINIGWMT